MEHAAFMGNGDSAAGLDKMIEFAGMRRGGVRGHHIPQRPPGVTTHRVVNAQVLIHADVVGGNDVGVFEAPGNDRLLQKRSNLLRCVLS